MGANDRSINTVPLIVTLGSEVCENLVPDALVAPAAVAHVDRIPLAHVTRKVAPGRPSLENPQDRVKDLAVAYLRRRANTITLAREQMLEPVVLIIGETVSTWSCHGQ